MLLYRHMDVTASMGQSHMCAEALLICVSKQLPL